MCNTLSILRLLRLFVCLFGDGGGSGDGGGGGGGGVGGGGGGGSGDGGGVVKVELVEVILCAVTTPLCIHII